MRDLGRVDPWQESLERSLARRGKHPGSGKPSRTAEADHGGRPDRPRTNRRRSEPFHRDGQVAPPREHHSLEHRPRERRPSRRRRRVSQPRLLAVGSWGILAVAVIMVTVAGLVDGHGAQASAGMSRAHAAQEHVTPLPAKPSEAAPGTNPVPTAAATNCRPVPRSSGYVNPLAGDVLIGERIDQGVDYAGSGRLTAIGAARITYVGTNATGWPGAFIEYRLLDGPDAGCFVYYAEGINPATGLHPGQRVQAGQVLADIIRGWATGIELGWGAGMSTKTYAAKTGRWSASDDADSVASAAGKSFSALITGLGGPAGRVEG